MRSRSTVSYLLWRKDADLLADLDIDAVYIATPVAQHLPQTLAAAAAGNHVLVEKKMARSVAECDAMIAACRQRGVQLGVAYSRRFFPVGRRKASPAELRGCFSANWACKRRSSAAVRASPDTAA